MPIVDIIPIIATTTKRSINVNLYDLKQHAHTTDTLKVKIKEEKLELNFDNAQISTLSDTGWTIIRSKFNWELLFKCGIPCPVNIGAHAHSDLLSFEIYCDGLPFINEVGTSTYEKGRTRIS